jgi:K+-sensing histidine kinase KdpD
VIIVALRFSYGPAILASIASGATLDYLFVPPRGQFAVDDPQYLLYVSRSC